MCSGLLCFVTVWTTISGLQQDLFSAELTVWISHSGFGDFSKGTFGDSGRNTHVSAAGHVQMIHRWEADTPLDTGIRFQVSGATTEKGLSEQEWTGSSGAGSYFLESGRCFPQRLASAPWIQYRAILTTPDGGNSPILKSVSLECRGDESN